MILIIQGVWKHLPRNRSVQKKLHTGKERKLSGRSERSGEAFLGNGLRALS